MSSRRAGAQAVVGNHASRLVAPEITAAFSPCVIAAFVAFAVTAIRIEIPPFAAVFAATGVGIIAVNFAWTGGTLRCNDYGFNGIGVVAGHRLRGTYVFG